MNNSNKESTSNPRDLEFLFEISCLRFIPRTGKHFLGADFGNLAEHHLRVIWIALLLAKLENIPDTEKIIKLSLIHDIAESRTGDVNYLQRQYTKRNEKMAIEDMLTGTVLEDECIALWEEYEKRKSTESKIVKDADNLDVDLSLREQKAMGHTLPDAWFEHREKVVKQTLFTHSAKDLCNKIYASSPYDWHLKGRNRLNGGDWKK